MEQQATTGVPGPEPCDDRALRADDMEVAHGGYEVRESCRCCLKVCTLILAVCSFGGRGSVGGELFPTLWKLVKLYGLCRWVLYLK